MEVSGQLHDSNASLPENIGFGEDKHLLHLPEFETQTV